MSCYNVLNGGIFKLQDIQDLLLSWSEHLKSCDRLFLRAPSYNKSLYFGSKTAPLIKSDPRIRMIPFATRRPTFKEVQRVHQLLATIEHYGIFVNIDKSIYYYSHCHSLQLSYASQSLNVQ